MRKQIVVGAISASLVCGLAVGASHNKQPGFSSAEAAATRARKIVVGLRRLSESQYRNSIRDIFGKEINVAGHFEPEARVDGLLATGNSILSITPAGVEGYQRLADSIAVQVVSDKNRDRLIQCKPTSPKAMDKTCATQVIRQYGEMIFRRPLTADELASRVAIVSRVTAQSNDFYNGLRKGIGSMLVAPEFLFRVETGAKTPDGVSVDGYTRASRISFLLWNSPPDAELLRAAASGELATAGGLAKQVDRLMASDRLDVGMRAFFADMLQLDVFDTLTKDGEIYPNFSDKVASSAKEETLRVVVDHTLHQNADYRDLMTTKKTFINRTLASIYRVPFAFKSEWQPYEFPKDSERSGVLTQVSFLSLFSHPGRSSPTKRGVALYEIFMCEPTPAPPANVDFSIVNGSDPTLKTIRARLEAHASNETCATCHTRSDPVGLSLENFNSIGEYRAKYEDGNQIDASAKIKTKSFVGAGALGQVLRDDPKIGRCVNQNIYAYGAGVKGGDLEPAQFAPGLKAFTDSGFKLRSLLRAVLTDESFYRILPQAEAPAPPAPARQQVANNNEARSRQ